MWLCELFASRRAVDTWVERSSTLKHRSGRSHRAWTSHLCKTIAQGVTCRYSWRGGPSLRPVQHASGKSRLIMNGGMQVPDVRSFTRLLLAFCGIVATCFNAVAAEKVTPYRSVAERRQGVQIICHRGSSEFAHENTLEAFRATFELGADGNEMDIRCTKDGVLVCFHDDVLDFALEAYGDVSDYTWDELQRFRFREPQQFGPQCRIPTLLEVFELHKRYGGLMHLDVKQRNLDQPIVELLDRLNLWDNVIVCETEIEGAIQRDSRLHPRVYQESLYSDHGDMFPAAIAAALARPGTALLVDDPRGAVVALGRQLGTVSQQPVAPKEPVSQNETVPAPREADLLAILRDGQDWDQIAVSEADQRASAERIQARARAADLCRSIHASSSATVAALENRVLRRSLHKQLEYHGLDGSAAMRTLILLQAPNAVEFARFSLWRDDPALEQLIDQQWKNPRAWADLRVKMVIFPALKHCRGVAAETLCRDYLALDEETAKQLGPLQHQEAARTLLAISPQTETALELMRHPLQAVRGRAILGCLAHVHEAWAMTALEEGAKHALAYRVPD